jgi:hypothetical protein
MGRGRVRRLGCGGGFSGGPTARPDTCPDCQRDAVAGGYDEAGERLQRGGRVMSAGGYPAKKNDKNQDPFKDFGSFISTLI